MKSKSTIWVGIMGVLIVLFSAIHAAATVSGHIEIMKVAVASVIEDLLWVGLGIFIIILSYRKRQKEESVDQAVKVESNSQEDIDRLRKNRRWILGFVLLVSALGSVDVWMLNNYMSGVTLINIFVLFDLISNAVLLWFVFQLFKGKEKLLIPLLYVVSVYSVVESVIEFMRGNPFAAIGSLVPIIYFAYAIKTPLNRKNYRIAHLIILPLLIVSFGVFNSLDNTKLNKINHDETLVEQQYLDASNSINDKYSIYLQRQIPTSQDAQDVQAAIAKRDEKSQALVYAIHQIYAQYQNHLPSIDREQKLNYLTKLVNVITIEGEQTDELKAMMQYAATIDFRYISQIQSKKLQDFKSAVDAYNDQITIAQFQLTDAK